MAVVSEKSPEMLRSNENHLPHLHRQQKGRDATLRMGQDNVGCWGDPGGMMLVSRQRRMVVWVFAISPQWNVTGRLEGAMPDSKPAMAEKGQSPTDILDWPFQNLPV